MYTSLAIAGGFAVRADAGPAAGVIAAPCAGDGAAAGTGAGGGWRKYQLLIYEEKRRNQVQIMADIYRKYVWGLIWLGELPSRPHVGFTTTDVKPFFITVARYISIIKPPSITKCEKD